MEKLEKPPRIEGVMCKTGDYAAPAATAETAGPGHFSYEKGWNTETETPVDEGGIPPYRKDFNGLMRLVSQWLAYVQAGGQCEFDPTLYYIPGCVVWSAGVQYRCLKPHWYQAVEVEGETTWIGYDDEGPHGTIDPAHAAAAVKSGFWEEVVKMPSLIVSEVQAGQVVPFYNCRVGGSDGRRLIPWGSSKANEKYVLCDGGSDDNGGTVPNLIGRFILPSIVSEAGGIGGSSSVTTNVTTLSAKVEATTLTLDQMPEHSHPSAVHDAPGHTHTRGSMNIIGFFDTVDKAAKHAQDAFYEVSRWSTNFKKGDSDNWGVGLNFEAARSWTGETSSSGAHAHAITVNSVGGNKSHTHGISGTSHSHTVKIPMPYYFKLAFFVKLPE